MLSREDKFTSISTHMSNLRNNTKIWIEIHEYSSKLESEFLVLKILHICKGIEISKCLPSLIVPVTQPDLPRGRQMHMQTKSSHRGTAGRGGPWSVGQPSAVGESMVRFFTCRCWNTLV
jgi:hypothetical protein